MHYLADVCVRACVWYDRNADGNTFLHLAVANGHTETARRILELLNGTEEQQLARRALEQQQELKRQKDAEDAKTKEEKEKKEKKGKKGEEVDIPPFSWPPAPTVEEKEVKEMEKEKEKKEDEDEEDDVKVKPPPQLLDVNADNMTEETPLHVAAYYGTRDETHNTRHTRIELHARASNCRSLCVCGAAAEVRRVGKGQDHGFKNQCAFPHCAHCS